MGRPSRFSPEVRERAVRMVEEHREAHASEWAVLQSVAPKLGCTAETLRKWVRQAQRDAGRRPGPVVTRSRSVESLCQLTRSFSTGSTRFDSGHRQRVVHYQAVPETTQAACASRIVPSQHVAQPEALR